MNNYRRINNFTGWFVFLVASYVYISTAEPTASFWDCGEFIATAYRLEVGHPPGAPLFLMMGRVMANFTNDPSRVAFLVNMISALASAFTILFLFWSITHLARKIIAPKDEMSQAQLISIMGAGLVGALAYTFSDSFWFSAVEGEVYATSSLFTALVFWAMLKWENVADEKHADRWLILIAYLMGLSIGVHLLNLLAIPALAFIYYFRKYKPTQSGLIATGLIGMVILGFVQYFIIPGTIKLAAMFDLFFVNSLGMGFGSGIIFYSMLVVGTLIWGLLYTTRRGKTLMNTALLCVVFILVGYTSFAQILIRSAANPPIDENNPENVFNFLSYLNREQYGDRPLFKGQLYTSRVVRYDKGAMNYIPGKDKYIPTTPKITPVYDEEVLLPRMYSAQENHIRAYKEWGGIKGDRKPTLFNNMKFFFSYQIGHMYMRYFMWNFAGRQNDVQGHGNITEGNWISGVPFIDKARLGPQDKLPESLAKNKARNEFYFLPLILGLVGVFYHFSRHKRDAAVVMLLFFFTGLAIIIYLNQTPYQPRERDYAYAASFYAFAIWIGFGVLAIIEWLRNKMKETVAAVLATAICLLAVPAIMAKEGWDDHDRSGRYTARDFARNYLESCAPNAILFTNGDNDTFPLWYCQEVEGIRTDVRVVNLSLLNTDWYIDQMKMKAYKSEPLPITMPNEKYVQGHRDMIPFYDRNIKDPVELKELVQFILNDDPRLMVQYGEDKLNYYPTKKFKLTVDRKAAIESGTVSPELADQIVPALEWQIGNNYLTKADIAILDLLANNNWERPVYFAITVSSDNYLGLEEYFQLEGLAYRLVPIKGGRNESQGRINTAVMYNNMMNKFQWGNMQDPSVYMDENNQRMTMNFRNNFGRLAEALLNEGKRDSAKKALDRCMEVMPESSVPFNFFILRVADAYYRAGEFQKGSAIVKRLADVYEGELRYHFSLIGSDYLRFVEQDMDLAFNVFQELIRISRNAGQADVVAQLEKRLVPLQQQYNRVGGAAQ